MIGDPSPINERLEQIGGKNERFRRVARKHEKLNVELNHSSLSRLMMMQIGSLGAEAQQRAAEYLVYMLELNFRAWDGLLEYYGGSDELEYYQPAFRTHGQEERLSD